MSLKSRVQNLERQRPVGTLEFVIETYIVNPDGSCAPEPYHVVRVNGSDIRREVNDAVA